MLMQTLIHWTGFSPDPYLSGALVYESTVGIQDAGVITNTKHFLGYEQETHRLAYTAEPYAEPVSSNIDDRTIHELYLWYANMPLSKECLFITNKAC